MFKIFKKRWLWIVALFVIINIVGLLKISLIVDGRSGASLVRVAQERISGYFHPVSRIAKEVKKKIYVSEFIISEATGQTYGNQGSIKLDTRSNVNLDEIKGYITVDPGVDFYIEANYWGIKLYGDFKPGKIYKVRAAKGMPTKDGVKLAKDFTASVVIPDLNPDVDFESPGMYLSLKGEQNIAFSHVNLEKVNLKVHKVHDNNIVYLLNKSSYRGIPNDLGEDMLEKEIDVSGELNQLRTSYLNFRDILSEKDRGVYYLTISPVNDDYYYRGSSKLLLTTDIGILARQGDADLLVWLNSLSEANSVSGADVKVFSKTNQLLYEGISDEKGFVHFENIDLKKEQKPYVITASLGGDLSFLEVETCVIDETAFDIGGRPYLSGGYESFVYSDRGVYRPGERVYLRSVVRGKGVNVPDSFPVNIVIKRPDGREFKKIISILNAFGIADVEADFPDYALTGVYTAEVSIPGSEDVIGSMSFNIEEFIPDNLKVSVKTDKPSYFLSDKVNINVGVEESFGAPAVDKNVELSYRLKSKIFKPKGCEDFTFVDKTISFNFKKENIGFLGTDIEGKALFSLDLPKNIKVPSSLVIDIGAVAKELGGRAVANYEQRDVYPYPFFIGIRKQVEGFGSTGQPVNFDFVTVDATGKEIVPLKLNVKVSKVIWNSILKKDKKGRYRYTTESREEVILDKPIDAAASKGEFSFTPAKWGDYIVRISGIEENSHTASIKFHASGYWSSQPWAMERPDRIELQLDKKSYAKGEIAKLLIKSPFKGKAIISCSTDKNIYTDVVEIDSLSKTVDIPVLDEFDPNAYCAVSVIRPVKAEEKWSAHRAYGIIPLVVDHNDKKINLSITAPSKVSSKDKVVVDITQQGTSEPLNLTVALVDDGILRLTGFKTPDPFDFFYGVRANGIETSDVYSLLMPEFSEDKVGGDSAPSGGKAYNPKRSNPVSAKRVKPLAIWKTNVLTDNQGKARVEFSLPEFNGTLKYMVVASGEDSFGSASGDIKAISPIILTPTVPRFLAMNDEFVVSTSVFNMTGKDDTILVSVDVLDSFKVLDEAKKEVFLKNEQEGFISFKIKAPSIPQKGSIKVSAVAGNENTSMSFEVPVRPAVAWTTVAGSGEAKAGQEVSFKIPGQWLKGTEKVSLSIASLPSVKLLGGLNYLLKYPYGCVEQTVSGAYPLLYLRNLASQVDPERYSPEAIRLLVQSGIEKVLAIQTFSGGFGWWAGYREVYPWGSVYAVDFLLDAEKAGYSVPMSAKSAGLNFLERILSGKEKDYSIQTKVYSAYVLAKAGRIKASWIRRFQERLDELPGSSRFYVAGALAVMGDRKSADNIFAQGVSDASFDPEQDDSLDSYVRKQASALSIYLDAAPDSPIVPILVNRINDAMKNGRWATTQENAAALIALGKYIKMKEGIVQKYKGTVIADGEKIAEFDETQDLNLSDLSLLGKEVVIKIEGEGSAYFYWSVQGVPLSNKSEEKDSGIKIRRTFIDKKGEPVDLATIKQGDVLIGEILVEPNGEARNMVIEDLLPAGFEILNPRLKTSEAVLSHGEKVSDPERIDMRDDRLVLFVDVKGKSRFQYAVRAVNPGTFVLPAIRGELMYAPSIYSVSSQGEVIIK